MIERKETRQYTLTVEGEIEKMYFGVEEILTECIQ